MLPFDTDTISSPLTSRETAVVTHDTFNEITVEEVKTNLKIENYIKKLQSHETPEVENLEIF